MALNRWVGGAAAVANVRRSAFGGTWLVAETVTVTVGSKSYVWTVDSATVATLLTNLATALTALSASAWPEFAEVTWSSDATHLIATATDSVAGAPIDFALTTNSASGTVGATATVTGNQGPNAWDTPQNWSLGYIPQTALTAPVQANATASSGGSLTNTQAYYWVITATNHNGETVKSNEKTLTIAAPNQTAHLSWAAVTGATGYKIYRGTSAGVYGASSLLTTITSGSTLTYIDTGAATGTGTPPGGSTALGDAVVIDDPTWAILYGLDQGYASVASLTHYARSTAALGLPFINTGGTAYPEWRPCYLELGIPVCTLGYGPGASSNLLKIDVGSVACALYVDATGRSTENLSAVMFKGSSASNTANVVGEVGFAALASESCNLSGGLTLGPGAVVRCGPSCTLAAIVSNGGSLETNSVIGTSLTQNGGATNLLGTGAVAQLTLFNGAQVAYNTSGTLGGNTTLDGFSVLSFAGDQRSKAVTNAITARSGSQVLDPFKVVSSLVVTSPDGTAQIAFGFAWTLTRT